MALGMEGVVESAHMGHPDFRVGKKIFATLGAAKACGMVKLTPEQQREFVEAEPKVFSPAAGAWGRGGSTIVQLKNSDPESVGRAMTLAWRNLTPKKSI